MKNLFISIVIFVSVSFFLLMILVAIGASAGVVGLVTLVLALIYLYLFCSHLYEIIKERNPLYTLSRGTKPGSLIRRISNLQSRKKQYQKLSDIYENKARDIVSSSAELLITEQDEKLENLKKAINKNKKIIEKNEIETQKKKKDKENKILELMDAKKELIKKVEGSEKSKRKKIDELKKNISDEKNLYKDLQSRHTLIAKWVKNR
ncbi:MAG: hypothetical protein HOH39_03885 [Gammaproteobacteria bacterium]|nr:hypothetical protein [Gammaproteobacteria bacterium]